MLMSGKICGFVDRLNKRSKFIEDIKIAARERVESAFSLVKDGLRTWKRIIQIFSI